MVVDLAFKKHIGAFVVLGNLYTLLVCIIYCLLGVNFMIIQSLFMLFFALTSNLKAESKQIFNAISQKDSRLVEDMLKKDEYSSIFNDARQTVLHAAVLANDLKSVKNILKFQKININQRDQNNKTALDYAVEYGHDKMVKILYKNQGKVTSVENAEYAKKLLIRPFKIMFFIGLPLFLTTFIVFFPLNLLAILVTPFAVSPGFILTVVGASGWISRSHRNLLI